MKSDLGWCKMSSKARHVARFCHFIASLVTMFTATLAKNANFRWRVKVLQIYFNANCWFKLAVTMLATLSCLSHCNHFILLRPLACLLYGTNHDTCDGLEEQGHDGHCHLETLGQILHGDQCYCHDHETNHEGAGCLSNWQVIHNKDYNVQSMMTVLILLLIAFLNSWSVDVIVIVFLLAKTKV